MDILSTYKPSGMNTHRTSEQSSEFGFVEWLEDKLKTPLYLFQRLDAGTSGLLLIATTEAAATYWSELLKLKKLSKKYLFITKVNEVSSFQRDQKVRVTSFISKKNGVWCSEQTLEPNSETVFTLLKSKDQFQLWSAEPITGKTHQIRLHAKSLRLPILGDELYGGAPFYRLCLHALEIQIKDEHNAWRAEAPPFFNNLEFLSNPKLCALIGALDLRDQLTQRHYLKGDTYRLVHNECPTLKMDQFGEQIWVYAYDTIGSENLLHEFFRYYPKLKAWVREMKNRGQQPNLSLLKSFHEPQVRWIASENNINYELRADQGLSPGLFLDQRENRLWIKMNSRDKKVLNLFSYTCGFSLNAAMGGAKEVVSVDVSSAFLEWGKRNFQLNSLDSAQYEFWAADSLEFLKRTLKLKRKFDLIICDPPSFGRSKNGVFNIEKNLSSMSAIIFELLEPKGQLLISSNFEKWTLAEFKKNVIQQLKKSYLEVIPPKYPLDFIEAKNPILKTLILERI